jgi:hypothetical protein
LDIQSSIVSNLAARFQGDDHSRLVLEIQRLALLLHDTSTMFGSGDVPQVTEMIESARSRYWLAIQGNAVQQPMYQPGSLPKMDRET